jgi:hypothetical protein
MQAGVFRGADIRGKRSSGNIYFIVSLILHLLVVIGFGLSGLRFRKPVAEDRVPRPEDRQAFLVVEIPDQVPDERPIQHTDLVSDRAARAADLSPENLEDLPILMRKETPKSGNSMRLGLRLPWPGKRGKTLERTVPK